MCLIYLRTHHWPAGPYYVATENNHTVSSGGVNCMEGATIAILTKYKKKEEMREDSE